MVLGFCIDRRFFGEVVLHSFGKTDEITTLEPTWIRVGREIGDEDECAPRSCASSF
jgi:hypothetical protein